MQTMLTGFSNKMPPDSSLNNPVLYKRIGYALDLILVIGRRFRIGRNTSAYVVCPMRPLLSDARLHDAVEHGNLPCAEWQRF